MAGSWAPRTLGRKSPPSSPARSPWVVRHLLPVRVPRPPLARLPRPGWVLRPPARHVPPMPLARPAALRRELERVPPERPFAAAFGDGTDLPATSSGGPAFTVRSPAAVAHVLRAPGQLGLGRAYVAGALEVD